MQKVAERIKTRYGGYFKMYEIIVLLALKSEIREVRKITLSKKAIKKTLP